MTDHELIQAIRDVLDGVVWTPETLDEIALLLTNAGYPVRDCKDVDDE